jgi:high-affinity iron transporter
VRTIYPTQFTNTPICFFLSIPSSHEFEEVLGETDKVYNFGVASVAEDGTKTYNRWSEKKLPMAVFKPFGYSAGPTQLMVGAFWSWLILGLVLHAWKYVSSKKIQAAEELANAERGGKTLEEEEDAETGQIDTAANSIKESDSKDDEYNEFVKSIQGN